MIDPTRTPVKSGQSWMPFSSGLINSMTNQANANTMSGLYNQNQGLQNQAAASGFGPNSPAELAQRAANFGAAQGQVAQNNLNIPLQAAQFNAQYGLGLGDLAALQQRNLAAQGLGQAQLGTQWQNALLGLAGGITGAL